MVSDIDIAFKKRLEDNIRDFNYKHNLTLQEYSAKINNELKYKTNYAPGVEVSNDNDEGGRTYENRLFRIHNVLFGYEFPSDKLPSFMQMEDLFPLRYDTNTHHLMMSNPSYSTDETPQSH